MQSVFTLNSQILEKLSTKQGSFSLLLQIFNGQEVRRAYSVCSSPFVDANPAVAVKRVEGGLMSNHLNDNLKQGIRPN